MARGSERNLYANIATVLDFNFIPGKWENKPDNLPEGARLAHSIIESAKGQEMHPCPAWGLRKHTSIKKDGEELVCNGITVRWLDCGTASGVLLPIVQLFEGFDEAVMPKDDFLFLEVPGLSVNSTHDPDIFQMMSKCGVDFEKNRLRRMNFLERLPDLVAEQVVSGYVSEEFFDELDVAIDMDAKGRQYPLTATSDVRGRARPLYSQIRIQEKTQEMVDGLEKERQKRRSVIEAAKCTFQMNLEAESRLQEMADEKYNGSLELLVYEDLFRLNIKHLIPYIQVRQVTDLTEPFKKLKKGTVQQAEEGQSCLLLQAKAVLGENITAALPEWSDVTVPKALELPKTKHWVWTSFIANFLKEISCLIVLAGLESQALKYATPLESLLNQILNVFPKMDEDIGAMDGSYLTADTLRQLLIRAGFAEQGFNRRWGEHRRASFLKDVGTRNRPQYQLFPHESVSEDQAPNRRGTFQQLEQRLGLGVRKADRARVLALFKWTEIDEAHLGKLSYGDGRAGTFDFKKYKHICFMFELFFAVALEPTGS
ncbi:hypothetical protein IV203_031234 [Nitzschia inconspicua]|uniref:Uncharacterized protein n=1 Tax=Nitzschia inconspicua TaxID=303405 RepID=A0A9K3LXP4_9STRA|nr:hypothetical protein IV203_031234 [Nitzschia inconspicua]